MTDFAVGYILLAVKSYKSIPAYLEETETTQVELAKRLGISQAHLSQIIGGQRSPSLELAALIEDETGVPMRALAKATA